MIDLSLNSHSQDFLEISNSDGKVYVNKIFKSNIFRANKCVLKQKAFSLINCGSIRIFAAEVLNYELSIDGTAILTMPYVEGITGSSYAVHATPLMAKALSSAISTLLLTEMSCVTDVPYPSKFLLDKVDQIEASTQDAELKELIHQGRRWIQLLPDSLLFPMGSCHGDLTLSNIIFNPVNGIVLIDFLDTFLESPLQDVAKIKQDFIYGWSFRKSSNTLKLKADILCKACFPPIITIIEDFYKQQVDVLTLLALLRIAPYVRDEITRSWLLNSLRTWFRNH
jgi:hypothetical protein